MKKDRKQSVLPYVVTAVLLIVMAVGAELLYGITKYQAFVLFAQMCLFPAVVNLLVIFSRVHFPETAKVTPSAEGETVEGVVVETKKSKLAWLYCIGRAIRGLLLRIGGAYNRSRIKIISVLAAVAGIYSALRFFVMMRRLTSIYTLNYPILIGLMVAFVVFIILDKWCVYAKTGDEFGDVVSKNLRSVMILLRLALAAIAVVVALTLLGLYDAQKILTYVLLVLFLYMGAFLVISFAVSLIKKELTTRPLLNIPAPFSIGASKDLGLLTYFEENTGMTMRSLWSMQVIRRLIPYTVTAIAIVFWLSTGIVQVEPYQKGVVYRFGQLEENVLDPGLHMTLPWPMDKIEVYDTETLNRMTVGYIPSEDSNNTWTGTHGSNEYKLLLGRADELVSINLRIEYKISDVRKYVMNNAKPEKLLEAYAYELVMSNTINTDLENLLSVDRNAFSASFRDELSNRIGVHDIGIAVVDVVLESIHPPIDVAEIYQKLVSAEIEAQRYILDAEAYAMVVVAAAETRRDTAVNVATADSYKKIAEAKAEVAEFMAGVEADKAYPSSYRYYKYLNAITKAYGNAKLVIVGEDIDTSKIYFGSLYKSDSSK